MSVLIIGTVIFNKGKTSIALTAADGPQTFSKELEAQLVSEGAATYTDIQIEPVKEDAPRGVATAVDVGKTQKTSDNAPDKKTDSKDVETAHEIPVYSKDMKVAELREIMDDCQLPFKVGMSKADMVAALDAYFGDEAEDDDSPPDLGAEDPIL